MSAVEGRFQEETTLYIKLNTLNTLTYKQHLFKKTKFPNLQLALPSGLNVHYTLVRTIMIIKCLNGKLAFFILQVAHDERVHPLLSMDVLG